MNRIERAMQQAARLRSKQEVLAKRLAKTQAIQRVEERKQRDKRRYLVGQLVEETGLFAWSDADLAAVIQALTPLRDTPHPAEVLAGMLHGITLNGAEDKTQAKNRSHASSFPLEMTEASEENRPCL